MKLGGFVSSSEKGTKMNYGPLGAMLKRVKGFALIYLVMNNSFDDVLLTDLWESEFAGKLGLFEHYYILEMDGLSNTITVCAPVIYADSGLIEMDQEEYNRMVRDEGLATLTISFDDVLAFRFLNVFNSIAMPAHRSTYVGPKALTYKAMPLIVDGVDMITNTE